jgi:hypothetical protein
MLEDLIWKHLYSMHFTRSPEEFEQKKSTALNAWGMEPALSDFLSYIQKEWLDGAFNTWQAYQTPLGYADTNNPLETFNKTVKSLHTNHERLRVVRLMRVLLDAAKYHSQIMSPFLYELRLSDRFLQRARKAMRERRVHVIKPSVQMENVIQLMTDVGLSDTFVEVRMLNYINK